MKKAIILMMVMCCSTGVWAQCTAPVLTGNPSNSTTCTNLFTNFNVTATGTSLSYLWEESTNGGVSYNPLSNGGVYSGVNTPTLTITNPTTSMSGYRYRCVVTEACNASSTSNHATVTVNQGPVFNQLPQSTSICEGGNATFSVNVTGSFTYSWQVSTNGGGSFSPLNNTAPYSGTNTQVLTITGATLAMNNYQYRLKVGGGLCGFITPATTAGTLTVNANVTYYQDLDNDTYGNALITTLSCTGAPAGYVANNLDCNDADFYVKPGGVEVCGNGIDEDCSGSDLSCGTVVMAVSINLTGTRIICKDETLTLTATPTFVNCPSTGLQWYEDGNPIPGATSASITLNRWSVGSYYVAAQCGTTIIHSDTLKANTVKITADSNRLCPAVGLELRVDPAAGVNYEWAEGTLTNLIPGAYSNTYTTNHVGNVWCWMNKPDCQKYGKFRTLPSNHCGSFSAKWEGSGEDIELNEEELADGLLLSNFNMYPNPAGNQVTLETSYLNGNAQLNIYDYSGRLVLQQKNLHGNVHSVDISMLSAAMYIVELLANNETCREKLIIQ